MHIAGRNAGAHQHMARYLAANTFYIVWLRRIAGMQTCNYDAVSLKKFSCLSGLNKCNITGNGMSRMFLFNISKNFDMLSLKLPAPAYQFRCT